MTLSLVEEKKVGTHEERIARRKEERFAPRLVLPARSKVVSPVNRRDAGAQQKYKHYKQEVVGYSLLR